MHPQHTGSVLLDIATAQRNELIASAEHRRRIALAKQRTRPSSHSAKRPWWWGLASRSHRRPA